eukprot:IDg5532t1
MSTPPLLSFSISYEDITSAPKRDARTSAGFVERSSCGTAVPNEPLDPLRELLAEGKSEAGELNPRAHRGTQGGCVIDLVGSFNYCIGEEVRIEVSRKSGPELVPVARSGWEFDGNIRSWNGKGRS